MFCSKKRKNTKTNPQTSSPMFVLQKRNPGSRKQDQPAPGASPKHPGKLPVFAPEIRLKKPRSKCFCAACAKSPTLEEAAALKVVCRPLSKHTSSCIAVRLASHGEAQSDKAQSESEHVSKSCWGVAQASGQGPYHQDSLPEWIDQNKSRLLFATKMVFPKSLQSMNSGSEKMCIESNRR